MIIPAIDLKDGCVVRFFQGRLDKKTYSSDPVKTARHWARQGAELIHVVDLDGAMSGKAKNLDIAKEIIKAVGVPVQFGGGLRSLEIIKELLTAGAFRVVLGTKAIEDEKFLRKAFKAFKDKIIISLDAKSDNIVTRGWAKSPGNKKVFMFAKALKEIGFKQVIYTDVLKDGSLKGPNIRAIKNLLVETNMGVIASGGVSSLEDISKLKLLEKKGLIGAIVGKALYEGRFTLAEALRLA